MYPESKFKKNIISLFQQETEAGVGIKRIIKLVNSWERSHVKTLQQTFIRRLFRKYSRVNVKVVGVRKHYQFDHDLNGNK